MYVKLLALELLKKSHNSVLLSGRYWQRRLIVVLKLKYLSKVENVFFSSKDAVL